MRGQLSQQATESLGHSALGSITERVDDVARLLGQRVTMGFPEVWDRPLPRHGTQRGRRWGWTAGLWLASLLTAGDHRHVSVATSRKGLHHTRSHRPAPVIAPLAWSDDRWRHRLAHVRTPTSWHQIARAVPAGSMAVYAWSQDVLRGDATTVSGAHEVTAGGLGQCGQSTEDPTRPQRTVLTGSVAPVGMALSTAGWSGARAEDGFDIPLSERRRTGWHTTGLLFVGAGKRSAWDPRASRARPQDGDVSPCPWTGATAEAMDAWRPAGVTQGEAGA